MKLLTIRQVAEFCMEWFYGPLSPYPNQLEKNKFKGVNPDAPTASEFYGIVNKPRYEREHPRTAAQARAWGYTVTRTFTRPNRLGFDENYYQYLEIPGTFVAESGNGGGLTYMIGPEEPCQPNKLPSF